MKTLKPIIFLVILSLVFSFGCSRTTTSRQAPAQKNVSETPLGLKEHNRGMLPDTTGIAYDTLRARIQQEMNRQETTALSNRVKEAINVILETQATIRALQKNDTRSALDSLKKAEETLDRLLAGYPDMKQIPVDASVEVINLAAGPDTVKAARKLVKKLVDRGELQQARRILDNLVSEIRVTTVYLPMATFPDAIRNARGLIEQGHTAMARQALEHALSSLVIREHAVPLPVVTAEALISSASAIADSSGGLAIKMLKNARRQLETARLLGYRVNDSRYKDLLKQIDELQRKISKGKKTEADFRKLKKDIRTFKQKF